jgi:hypothetical protein
MNRRNKENAENNVAFDFYGTQIFPGMYIVYGSRAGDHGIIKRGVVVELRKGKPVCDWDVKKFDFNICNVCKQDRSASEHTYGNAGWHHLEQTFVGIEKQRGRAVDPDSCVVVLGY